MKFPKSDRDAHPKLTKWLEEELPKRSTRPTTWQALCDKGLLDEAAARSAITLNDSNPILKLRDLDEGVTGRVASGRFEISKPNWIQVALDLVLKVEKEIDDEQAALLLEATILHEIVHWARFRNTGVGELQDQEFGLDFELAAYGKIVYRYWDTASPAPMLVFPVTGKVGAGTAYWGRNIRANGTRSHFGIDIYNDIGTPVYAAADGVVIGGDRYRVGAARLSETGNYGQMVDVDHHNGLVTRYAHLNEVVVRPGAVKQGDRIGSLGASGTDYGHWFYGGRKGQPPAGATLPHLHFEVRRANGAPFRDFDATYDPATFFDWMPDGPNSRGTPTRALAPGSPPSEYPAVRVPAAPMEPAPPTSRGVGVAYPNHDYAPSDPRGLRNNNPGNIKKTADSWQGLLAPELQLDPVFFQFQEMRWGIRAIARILRRSYGSRGIDTLSTIAATWAPSVDQNAPDTYAITLLRYGEGVAATVGDALDLDSIDTLFGLCRGIIVAENGPGPAATVGDDVVREGVALERA